MNAELFPLDREHVGHCEFEAMRLQVGTRVEVRRLPESLNPRLFTTVIGYVPGVTVLLRMPMVNGLAADLYEGDKVHVRAFDGTHAYGFASEIERVCIAPLRYLHLTWPKEVQCVEIRHAPRLPVDLTAKVRVGESWLPARLRDLAQGGCLLEAGAELGAAGEAVELEFTLPRPHQDETATLHIRGRLHPAGSARDQEGHVWQRYGVEFEPLGEDALLLLQSYLFRLLLDHPNRHG